VAEALYRGGVSAEEVGRFFVSDDFAAVPVGLGRALGRPLAQLYGGALASGYAAGADGIRLLGELSLSLASGEARFGLAASWAEGGGAEALLLEAA
jgi:acetyl-CoA acetyltransferase